MPLFLKCSTLTRHYLWPGNLELFSFQKGEKGCRVMERTALHVYSAGCLGLDTVSIKVSITWFCLTKSEAT